MEIYRKLLKIQKELKAPKNQFNKFGGYKYRNCEDILEALKPLCFENSAVLIIKDEVVSMDSRGGYEKDGVKIEKEIRFYVKATATLIDADSGEKIETHAFAREEETKKGMDSCQVTGSASSYARKYALNALFCIDDTKDSDYTNGLGEKKEKETTNKVNTFKISNPRIEKMVKMANEKGFSIAQVKQTALDRFGKIRLEDLSDDEVSKMEERLRKVGGK